MGRKKKKNRKEPMSVYTEKPTLLTAPELIITQDVYHKIMHWVDKASGEVSGLGKIVDEGGGKFRVVSAMLLPQKNSGASTDIEATDVAKAMFELRNEPGTLNFWWHSHVNMGVFWSSTDTDTIEKFGEGGFVFSTVFNKKREMLSSLYVKAPFEKPMAIFLGDIKHRVVAYLDADKIKEWDAQYEKNCTSQTTYLSKYNKDEKDTPTQWERDNGIWTTKAFGGLTYKRWPINKWGEIIGPSIEFGEAEPAWVKEARDLTPSYSIEQLMLRSVPELEQLLKEKKILKVQFDFVNKVFDDQIEKMSDEEFADWYSGMGVN